MGNEPSTALSCTSDSSNIALAFHANGIYGVRADGGYTLVNKENWNRTKVALPTSKGDAIVIFHQHATYFAPMAEVQEQEKGVGYLPKTVDGKVVLVSEGEGIFRVDNSLLLHDGVGLGYRSSKDPPVKWDAVPPAKWGTTVQAQDDGDGWIQVAGITPTKIQTENISVFSDSKWKQAVAVVRTQEKPESLFVFHGDGIYEVSISDGRHKLLIAGSWGDVKAIVYSPAIPGHVFTFNFSGIFKVNLSDGSHEKVSSDGWYRASSAVYDPDSEAALVFHGDAIYKVKLADGSFTAVNRGNWTVLGAVSCGDGKAIAFCTYGMYAINMLDGSDSKLNSECWGGVASVCPLGSMSFFSNYYQRQQG